MIHLTLDAVSSSSSRSWRVRVAMHRCNPSILMALMEPSMELVAATRCWVAVFQAFWTDCRCLAT